MVDTNIPVYATDTADPVKQKKAIALIDALRQQGEFFLSAQVLSEFFRALTNPKKGDQAFTREEAAVAVQSLALSANRVYPVTEAVVLRAVDAVARYRLSVWDALIWAVAKENGDPVVYTEDVPGTATGTIDGIAYINPFAPPAP